MKKSILSLLLISFAVTSFADQDRPAMTNQGINPRKNSVLPPRVIEKYQYYDVCGCSEKDLQCDLTQKAIRCDDGKKYDSVTDWKVKWDYGYSRAAKSCAVDSFTVTAEIVLRLPKWTQNGEAPPQLHHKWATYMKNLIMHEEGHRDRVVAAATELTEAIAEMPAARTCADLDRELRRLCRIRTDKLIRDHKEYDAATNHGQTQGAVFP